MCEKSGKMASLRYSPVKPYLVLVVHLAHDAHGLRREGLLYDLGPATRALGDTEAQKHGVGHLDQDVVDAVTLDVLDAPREEIVEDPTVSQRPVQASITI